MRQIESKLARYWRLLAAAAVLIFALGCAHSHLAVDPQTGEQVVVTEGTNLLPDVLDDVIGVPAADIVGSAGDALSDVDIGQTLSDAGSGNWLAVIGTAVTVIGGIVGGVALRRRKKRRLA